MDYELTTYGEEYRETIGARSDKMWEHLPKETTPEGLTKLKPNKAFARLQKRGYILDLIHRGEDPIEDSFDYLKPGPRKARAQGSLRRN